MREIIDSPTQDSVLTKKFLALQRVENFKAKNGKELVMRKIEGDNSYNVYLGQKHVFFAYDISVEDGWLTVLNIGPVREVDADEYVGQGIGKFLFDAIENDALAIGAKGYRPAFGFMSADAKAFWKKRLTKQFGNLEEAFLGQLLDIPSRTTIGQTAFTERILKSEAMFEDLHRKMRGVLQ